MHRFEELKVDVLLHGGRLCGAADLQRATHIVLCAPQSPHPAGPTADESSDAIERAGGDAAAGAAQQQQQPPSARQVLAAAVAAGAASADQLRWLARRLAGGQAKLVDMR